MWPENCPKFGIVMCSEAVSKVLCTVWVLRQGPKRTVLTLWIPPDDIPRCSTERLVTNPEERYLGPLISIVLITKDIILSFAGNNANWTVRNMKMYDKVIGWGERIAREDGGSAYRHSKSPKLGGSALVARISLMNYPNFDYEVRKCVLASAKISLNNLGWGWGGSAAPSSPHTPHPSSYV